MVRKRKRKSQGGMEGVPVPKRVMPWGQFRYCPRCGCHLGPGQWHENVPGLELVPPPLPQPPQGNIPAALGAAPAAPEAQGAVADEGVMEVVNPPAPAPGLLSPEAGEVEFTAAVLPAPVLPDSSGGSI
jgi:hypothetical protein